MRERFYAPMRKETIVLNKEMLQEYLWGQIPISKAMGIEVLETGQHQVTIRAPLSANKNHMQTVFGGSACAVAMLSAWSLLYLRLRSEEIAPQLVLHKTAVTFERPITDTFTATTMFNDEPVWKEFVSTLTVKKKAGIHLSSTLRCNGVEVGKFDGDFVSYF